MISHEPRASRQPPQMPIKLLIKNILAPLGAQSRRCERFDAGEPSQSSAALREAEAISSATEETMDDEARLRTWSKHGGGNSGRRIGVRKTGGESEAQGLTQTKERRDRRRPGSMFGKEMQRLSLQQGAGTFIDASMKIHGASMPHPPEGYFNRGLEADPELAAAIDGELARQRDGIELIASENIVSQLVLAAQGSVLTNKTVEGPAFGRYYGGAQFADAVESLALERARKLFRCRFANVQPHSGSNANAGVFLGLLKLGDTILSMNVAAGGHISHGHPATLTGRDYKIVSYGVRRDDERIDLDDIRARALTHKPKMIVAGGSAYPRAIDFAALRAIADEVGAYLLVDMAHFAGLVATGFYPDPLPHADVVTTTTYKSLRGARGGLVLWNDEKLSSRINAGVFPGVQGSVMLHAVAGKAACFGEALRPEFRSYNAAVIDNAHALATALDREGLRIVAGGTDMGLMLVDLTAKGVTGDVAAKALEQAGLAANKNLIPFDPRPPEAPSGLRLSSNAGTARGFGQKEFETIGGWIAKIIRAPHDTRLLAEIQTQTLALCRNFPIY
jgi:glycine hydroxymethyltransferase